MYRTVGVRHRATRVCQRQWRFVLIGVRPAAAICGQRNLDGRPQFYGLDIEYILSVILLLLQSAVRGQCPHRSLPAVRGQRLQSLLASSRQWSYTSLHTLRYNVPNCREYFTIFSCSRSIQQWLYAIRRRPATGGMARLRTPAVRDRVSEVLAKPASCEGRWNQVENECIGIRIRQR